MGLGRAPGSDARTAYALQATGNASGSENYLESVLQIRQLLRGANIETGPLSGLEALPKTASTPEMWLLASSEGSASVAAHCGLPLSWAHFINGNGPGTCELYRDHYSPSEEHPYPQVSVGVSVLCADTETEAKRMLASLELWRRDGLRGPIPPANDVAGSSLQVSNPSRPMIIGDQEQVLKGLVDVAEKYQSKELLLVTICFDHAQRLHSYRLIAEAFKL